ncbi:MAG: ribose 5-phosphate isomerase B [Candidatus Omnitrophica bacterium]|nr:ribose 5-phosphate isomerase B [Candidatus Omnitrophota bacterium]
MKKIIIASDHAGFRLKEKVKSYLGKINYEARDLGTYSEERCDYPELAYHLAKEISRGHYSRGILICNSGIGHSIVANRVPGVRAALCYNAKVAQLSREHNDSNVLVLGSGFVSEQAAKKILKVWLNTEFQGGRHLRRLNQLKKIEKIIGARE